MEVMISTQFGICQEIYESPLFYKFVFLIDSIILKLLFGMDEMLVLNHLHVISPLVSQLSIFIVCKCTVEYGELWTNHESEMSNLNEAYIISNKEFMMENHSSEPFIMLPSTKSRNRVD